MKIQKEDIFFLKNDIKDHFKLISRLSDTQIFELIQVSKLITKSIKKNNIIFSCGNGGSASQSQHFVSELIGKFNKERTPLPAISLNADSSVLTCISNDFDYKNVFSRQIEGLGKKGDLLIVFSTSGNSVNINRALISAKSMGIFSIAFLGNNGGLAKKNCSQSIIVSSDKTARIQELHLLFIHLITNLMEKDLGFE